MEGNHRTLSSAAATASAPQDAREAARLASLRRFAAVETASPAPSSLAVSGRIKDAKKALDRELHAIPDYLHNSPGIILDCINLLLEICGKTAEHVRKGGDEFKINTAVFERKSHGIAHGYEALLRLGFRPKVVEMKKYAVHEGLFDDKDTELRFLDEAASAIAVAKAGVETHVQSFETDTRKRKEEDEIRRQRALAAFEEDREGVQKRLQRAA